MIRYGTAGPVAGASTGGQLTNNTTYYLVCEGELFRAEWFTSANMWLNPSLTDDVDTPAGDAALDFADFANPDHPLFFRASRAGHG